MTIIRHYTENDAPAWDAYVRRLPNASVYHLSGWKRVIEKSYGHRSCYLLAANRPDPGATITGVFPLFHFKHWIFGNHMVSMPFFDHGGILADDTRIAAALQGRAIRLARRLKAADIESRYIGSDTALPEVPTEEGITATVSIRSHKVRMLLNLPASAADLMKSFKAKLRSQIKKPIKEGLSAKVGGLELLEDFYRVFVENMRDLGSPVHSEKIIRHTLGEFADSARIVAVYKGRRPLAGSVVVGFGKTLFNPWASSLREFSRLAPNMLLYWIMLEYACESGYRQFDFGRSTPDEGTFKFKQQWGAVAVPLQWQSVHLDGRPDAPDSDKEKFSEMIEVWQKLPVPLTRLIGPMVRKHIAL